MKKLLNTLYVTTQDTYLRKDGETVVVEKEKQVLLRLPIHTLQGIVTFGNVMTSPFLLNLCAERGVCVSSGSACTSGSLEPSHVLVAMNVPSGALQWNFRFSLSRYTTDEEIDRAIDAFAEAVALARETSCKWDSAKGEPIA